VERALKGEKLPCCFGRHVLIGASRSRCCAQTLPAHAAWQLGMRQWCDMPSDPPHKPPSIWAAWRDSPALCRSHFSTQHTQDIFQGMLLRHTLQPRQAYNCACKFTLVLKVWGSAVFGGISAVSSLVLLSFIWSQGIRNTSDKTASIS